jgi:hypothetical protein
MKHRFESGITKMGFPQQAFIIEVDSLDLKTLKALPGYLIKHCDLIFAADQEAEDETMYPIVVSIGSQLEISEQILWAMISDTLPNAKAFLVEYVQKLCQLAAQTEDGCLFYNDGNHFAGSFALFAFLDRYFELDECNSPAATAVYQCFIQYLRYCDLDFEVYQDGYIEKVLSELVFFDDDKFIELLCLRLCSGVCCKKDFRYLFSFLDNFTSKPGYLKRAIDYLIDSENETEAYARTNEAIYLKLCAATYGNNNKETDEVMDYVRQKMGDEFICADDFHWVEVQRIRDECDAFRKSQPSSENFINSSFHLYDQKNKQWLSLDTDVGGSL